MDEIKKFTVIGNPVGHSLSPMIHKEFAKQQGIKIEYKMIEPESEDHFETHTQSFFSKKGYGANVTIPFKELAFKFANDHDLSTIECKCANTLISKNGKIKAYNTDGQGFIRDLENKNIDIVDKEILVLGAGGSASSIINSLSKLNIRQIDILSRTQQRIDGLIDQYKNFSNINNYQNDKKYDLIINTTPVSLTTELINFPTNIFNPTSISYDLFYSKSSTHFETWARSNNSFKTYNGIGMLIEQAALSYEIWNNFKPNTEKIAKILGF